MRAPTRIAHGLTAAVLFAHVLTPAGADEPSILDPGPAAAYTPAAAEVNAFGLLSTARQAVDRIDAGQQEDRDILFDTAIVSLTALYELHGCEWALPSLVRLHGDPGCPDIHTGHSEDGRLSLRLQPLELQNPAFTQYTIYLLTLEGNSALELQADSHGTLELERVDGTTLGIEELTPEHPLWPNLDRLAHTFAPEAFVLPGRASSFKQIVAVPKLDPATVARARYQWGDYALVVTWYENLPPDLRPDIL